MATNPNSLRISQPIWDLWESFHAHNPRAELGGIFANKAGYHNYRNNLPPDDYSVEDVPEDRLGPGDKAAAIDIKLNPADMITYTRRLDVAARNKDPRLFVGTRPVIREFIGTLDGSTVYCYVLTGGVPLGVGRDAGVDYGRDKTHLWHIHISFIRKYVNDPKAIYGVLSVLKGEPLSDWRNKMAVLDNSDVVKIWTHDLVNGPEVEQAYKMVIRIANTVTELKAKIDKLAATPPGSVVVTDEQLERVLRKVIGSVDSVESPPAGQA